MKLTRVGNPKVASAMRLSVIDTMRKVVAETMEEYDGVLDRGARGATNQLTDDHLFLVVSVPRRPSVFGVVPLAGIDQTSQEKQDYRDPDLAVFARHSIVSDRRAGTYREPSDAQDLVAVVEVIAGRTQELHIPSTDGTERLGYLIHALTWDHHSSWQIVERGDHNAGLGSTGVLSLQGRPVLKSDATEPNYPELSFSDVNPARTRNLTALLIALTQDVAELSDDVDPLQDT